MFGCFGGSEREAAAQALQAANQTVAALSQREAQLNSQLAASQRALQQQSDEQQSRYLQLEQTLEEHQAQLQSTLQLNASQASQIETLESKCQELTAEGESLQGQLEAKRRQAKTYATQVSELKMELAKKHKQQEHLKSKYQKMQEAMRMLEEVVVCVVGGQPEPTGPGGRRAPQQQPRLDRTATAPGPDIVAKRFNQLRASANELRQSLAAYSLEERRELPSSIDESAASRPEDDASAMPGADQAVSIDA